MDEVREEHAGYLPMSTRQPVVEMMDPMMVEVMRSKTPAERLAIAFRMWRSVRVMLRGVLQQEHPEWSDEMTNQEIARRISHGEVSLVGQ